MNFDETPQLHYWLICIHVQECRSIRLFQISSNDLSSVQSNNAGSMSGYL